ncbi:MAG: glycyl-radical enzyme activating protein [Selenomonadaceae bacterium]|nr:glycyl-radical enzyme activating protein [Selenomonadaceae bacterium]
MYDKTRYGMIFNIQKFSINDGYGIRTVVFFKGCPLKCTWCSNPESQEPHLQILWDEKKCLHCETCVKSCPSLAIKNIDGKIIVDSKKCSGSGICTEKCPGHALKSEGEFKTVAEIMEVVMQDLPFYEESGGGVTLSGGEAMMQPEFAIELLKALKGENIHTAIETTGFVAPEIFREVIKYLDLLLFDIKHWDETKHKEKTSVSNIPILQNMKYAIDIGKDVLPRLPVIPNYNNSLDDARGFVRRLNEVGAKKVQLLPFHQFGESKYAMLGRNYEFAHVKGLHPEDLTDFRKIFLDAGIDAFF